MLLVVLLQQLYIPHGNKNMSKHVFLLVFAFFSVQAKQSFLKPVQKNKNIIIITNTLNTYFLM